MSEEVAADQNTHQALEPGDERSAAGWSMNPPGRAG